MQSQKNTHSQTDKHTRIDSQEHIDNYRITQLYTHIPTPKVLGLTCTKTPLTEEIKVDKTKTIATLF